MNRNGTQEFDIVLNKISILYEINRCKNFLSFLKRNYNDEFTIMYGEMETCELEEDVLRMIIEHYENKLDSLNKELEKL